MKILYITTIGGTMDFFKGFIKELLDDGHTVDIATNENESKVSDCYREWGCKVYPISCTRSPLDKGNIDAVRQIRKIAAGGHYDIVHCHTPIAAACTRIACKPLRKNGLKVFYTAHGFHFYRGASLKNWLVYYPMEWLCAHWTDTLITINREDYDLACRKMRAGKVEYVPGVGIDVDRFANAVVDRAAKRREIGVPEDALLLLSVGELNENKNHQVVIRALAELKNPDIHYMIAGRGPLRDHLAALAQELGVERQVHLLGFRTDVAELYKTADVDVFPSIREGLGLAALEGMAAGLPLIAADNRGTRNYARDGKNGIVSPPTDVDAFALAIQKLYENPELYHAMASQAERDAKAFEVEHINHRYLESIYHI